MKHLLPFFGAALLASPVAPQGCASVSIGVKYQGQYADYGAAYVVNNGHRTVELNVESDGKAIKEFRAR